MPEYYCPVCDTELMKEIQHVDTCNDCHGERAMWKQIPVIDSLHPAGDNERIMKVWCPNCGLMFNPVLFDPRYQ